MTVEVVQHDSVTVLAMQGPAVVTVEVVQHNNKKLLQSTAGFSMCEALKVQHDTPFSWLAVMKRCRT